MSDFASKYAFALAESDSESDEAPALLLKKKNSSANKAKDALSPHKQQSSATQNSKRITSKAASNANSRQSSPTKKPINKFLQNLISDSDDSDGDDILSKYRKTK